MCYKAIIGAIVLLFSFVSCKKESKIAIDFYFKMHIPYDSTAISGAKYNIHEYKIKGKLGEIEYTDFKLVGTIGESGIAYIKFFPKKSTNYHYNMSIDYSEINVPFSNYTIINPPNSVNLIREEAEGQVQRDYVISVLPKLEVQFNFKNLNCSSENDIFKFKYLNVDESPDPSWSFPWSELNGCVDITGNFYERTSGRYIFMWESNRGGIFEQGIDTFFVAPNKTNKINMFW